MKRKKRLKRAMCVVLLAACVVSGLPAASASAKKQVTWPSGPDKSKLSCSAAIVMELSTGSILYKKNIHKQYYPASITKILTAMLTAENCSSNEIVTFSHDAAYGISAGDSTVSTQPGEKMTVEQCLYAIMLQSANEVCLGVAEHVSGSVSNFVDLMNQRVKELGLKDTHFNNPNGLPDTKHYTTAYDMAVIARAAMQNETFARVTATRSYQMAKTNKHKARIWSNHHQMINGYQYPQYEYKYCIGGKTGFTRVAKNTLVTYAEKNGMQLVCVVMHADSPKAGEPNEYTDTTKLLNYGFEKYKKYTVDEEASDINEDLFNNYGSYFDTEKSPVHLEGEASVVLPKGVTLSQAKQTISYEENVTLKTGDNVIGTVTYTYGGRTVGSADIIYTKTEEDETTQLDEASRKIVSSEIQELEQTKKSDEKKANLWRRIKKGAVGFFKLRVVRVIGLLLALAIILFGIVCAVRHIEFPRLGKRRRRMTGGYRSRRGQRRHARDMRAARRREKIMRRRGRRNHSRQYERRAPRTEKTKRSRGVQYHKNHKRTKESFGKNFFDF